MQKAEGLPHHRGLKIFDISAYCFFKKNTFLSAVVANIKQLVVVVVLLLLFFLPPVLRETFVPEQHANGGHRRPQHTQHARGLQPLGRVQEIGQCAKGGEQ